MRIHGVDTRSADFRVSEMDRINPMNQLDILSSRFGKYVQIANKNHCVPHLFPNIELIY